jgi:hypothetical protein
MMVNVAAPEHRKEFMTVLTTSLRAASLGLALGLAAACSSDRMTGPALPVVPPIASSITGTCSNTATPVAGFIKNWTCNTQVRLSTPAGMTSAEVSALSSAVSRWNGGVLSGFGLPKFVMSGGTQVITVAISGSGDYYCGNWPDKFHLNIGRSAAGTCTNPGRLSTGTLSNLFLHELSHGIGFQSGTWHKPSTPEFTGHCAAALYSATRPLNAALCQHEIEAIYASYGLRSTAPDLFKHVMTGLAGLAPITVNVGATGTLTVTDLVFNRVNGTFCGQPDTTVCEGNNTRSPTEASLSWSITNGSIASLSGTGASRTVTGLAGGSATVNVNATTSTYEKAAAFGDAGTGTSAAVTVVAVPPAGPPTSLSASGITATSALVSWTNGDASAGTTTVVQYRMTRQSAWINAPGSPAGAGVSSLTIGGLNCATSYDVNVYHVKSGISSAALTLTLFTTAACQVSGTVLPPSGFNETSCSASTSGGKNYATYTLSWTAGANPSSTIYQIGEALTNSSANAAVIRTGGITKTSDDVGPYLVTSTASPRYFWVRHVNGGQGSAWVALTGNPIQIKSGCLL